MIKQDNLKQQIIKGGKNFQPLSQGEQMEESSNIIQCLIRGIMAR
jgi:hypothetical protein